MKKKLIKVTKSTIIAVANVCLLCGAGPIIDVGMYLVIRSGRVLKKHWQHIVEIFDDHRPLQT